MKKSVKLIAAACASLMALSGAMTVTAASIPSSSSFNMSSTDLDSYIFSQIRNAIPVDGGYYIPGIGVITTEQYQEIYNRYLNSIYNPSYPGSGWYPGTNPSYPGFPWNPGSSSIQTVDITMKQFESQYLGNSYYTYTSDNTDVVTVDSYGRVYAVGAGKAIVTASSGYYTYIIYNITVEAVDASESGLSLHIYAPKTILAVGDSTTLSVYLSKNGMTVASPAAIDIESDSPDIIAVNGNTVTAISDGSANITATLHGTDIKDSVTIRVFASSTPSDPSYPWNPSYPSYPWTPSYPWNGGSGWQIGTPGSNNGFINMNIASWLNVDTTRFSVQYKTMYFNGRWVQAYVVVPKDGSVTDFTGYDIQYKNVYINNTWAQVMVLVPQGVDISKKPTTDKPTTPEKPAPTPEEREELAKKEAEEKRLKELQQKISDAVSGKIGWYEVYSDIYGDSYYSAGVKFVLDNQYLTGKNDGSFGAQDAVTYADVKEMFLKYLHLTDKEFDELGILSFTDGTKKITRQELVTAFYKAAEKLEAVGTKSADLTGFADYKDLKNENSDAFGWAVANKLMNKSATKINPNGTVEKTRLAQMLYVLDKLAK